MVVLTTEVSFLALRTLGKPQSAKSSFQKNRNFKNIALESGAIFNTDKFL
jgi:hypothetical protein